MKCKVTGTMTISYEAEVEAASPKDIYKVEIKENKNESIIK